MKEKLVSGTNISTFHVRCFSLDLYQVIRPLPREHLAWFPFNVRTICLIDK